MPSYAHLTAEEEFNLTGTLSAPKILELLEAQDALEGAEGVPGRIDEAKGQFPAEDFLEPVIDMLREQARYRRGESKQQTQEVIEKLEALQLEVHQATEYGLFELNTAIAELIGAEPPEEPKKAVRL